MAMSRAVFAAAAGLLLFCGAARAQQDQQPLEAPEFEFSLEEIRSARTNPPWFTLDPASVRIARVAQGEDPGLLDKLRAKADASPADGLVLIEKIINIAEKLWAIVEKNAPVVNIDTQYATAVPEGITAWTHLQNWSSPRTYTYAFSANNLYGVKVVDVRYKVAYAYGGNYKGKGLYLTGVTVIPEKVTIGSGYKFNMSAQVPDSTVVNMGTHEAPRAGLQLKVNWRIATALKVTDGTSVYFIQGDGGFGEIASPWKAPPDHEPDLSAYPSVMQVMRTDRIFE